MNKKTNDGIGNHPEAQKIKGICNISPHTHTTKQVCEPLNQFRKVKTKKIKK